MTVQEALSWRYATKKFDPTKKLTREQLDRLLESVRLAPSSFGLSPWKIVVVSNDDTRKKLKEAGYGQPQITDASHLFVFAVQRSLNNAYVDEYLKLVATERNVHIDDLKDYGSMMKDSLSQKTSGERIEWAARQAYIALGVLVTAGAVEKIDVAPMEGFNPNAVDELLGLEERGLHSVALAAVGYRSSDDQAASMPKIRFPKEYLFIEE